MRQKDFKPGRTARITEPMNAVDIEEIQALAELDLTTVTGGCARCGCSQPNPRLQSMPDAER